MTIGGLCIQLCKSYTDWERLCYFTADQIVHSPVSLTSIPWVASTNAFTFGSVGTFDQSTSWGRERVGFRRRMAVDSVFIGEMRTTNNLQFDCICLSRRSERLTLRMRWLGQLDARCSYDRCSRNATFYINGSAGTVTLSAAVGYFVVDTERIGSSNWTGDVNSGCNR